MVSSFFALYTLAFLQKESQKKGSVEKEGTEKVKSTLRLKVNDG